MAVCMESFPSRELLVEHWEQVAQWSCKPRRESTPHSTVIGTTAGTAANTTTASSTAQSPASQPPSKPLRRSPRLMQTHPPI
ncbi:hypothetical protein FRB91_003421 [Serendipita sp. 411]|nr:hypothetical protein FRB91_003421 [Serendipita sp. 411]